MELQESIRLAIADDHEMVRAGLVASLSGMTGISIVAEADNGQSLISRLETLQVLPDIVLLDVSMPVMDGHETLKAIKLRWPELKVLMLSMYDAEHTILKMMNQGARGYVLKAGKIAELYTAIREIYQYGFYSPEYVSGRMARQQEPQMPRINEKEIRFLQHCCTELSYRDIASLMNVSVRTVEGYRDTLFMKLHLNTRVGLVMYAYNTGLVPLSHTSDLKLRMGD
ncbi:response regulator [Chitinophagaceae bacterium MMS25-I14]